MTTRKRDEDEHEEEGVVEASPKKKPKEKVDSKEEEGLETGETLTCRDCQQSFIFSDGEKEFYEKKGWMNKPSRCKSCQAINKLARNEGVPATRGVCYAHQRGECDRGDSCRYSHDASAGAAAAGSGASGASRRVGGGVCYAHQRGQCNRGDQCRFSHEGGSGGGGSLGGSGGGGGSERPRGVCFDHQKGRCERGDGCRFSHDAAQ